MTKLFRPACLCAAVAAAVSFPFWATGGGWEAEARRGQRLDADTEILAAVLAAKQQVMADLTAGRITRAEAAGRFQAIDADRPAHLRTAVEAGPGETPDAAYARHIAGWVLAREQRGPEPLVTRAPVGRWGRWRRSPEGVHAPPDHRHRPPWPRAMRADPRRPDSDVMVPAAAGGR